MSELAYFVVPKSHLNGYKLNLQSAGDVLLIDVLKSSYNIGEVDGLVAVEVFLNDQDSAELLDPESIEIIGIGGSYAGPKREDLKKKFPQFDGTYETTTDGEITQDFILKPHEWKI